MGLHVSIEQRTVRLPLRPLGVSFIINTLFYALLLWLLIFAPFAARRMLRRRRGQCEKCAYPIGTWGASPVCTECGAAVRQNEVGATASDHFRGRESAVRDAGTSP